MSRKIDFRELQILAEASKEELWILANGKNRDVKIYLHWSAGHYQQIFEEYHLNICGNGDLIASTDNFAKILAHTYCRNTGAVGISLCCAYLATPADLGLEPPTIQQIATLTTVIAILAKVLDLTIDQNRVMTHGEAGDNVDSLLLHECYGQNTTRERWDLAILKENEDWGSGGIYLRKQAQEKFKILKA